MSGSCQLPPILGTESCVGTQLCSQRRPMWDLGALFLHIWHGETSTVNKSTLARSKGMLLRNIASGSRLRGSVRRAWHCLGSSRRFHHRAWSWRCLCGNGQRSKKKKSSGEGCSEVKIMGSSPVGPEGHVGVLQASGRAPGSPQSLRWGRERWEGKGRQWGAAGCRPRAIHHMGKLRKRGINLQVVHASCFSGGSLCLSEERKFIFKGCGAPTEWNRRWPMECGMTTGMFPLTMLMLTIPFPLYHLTAIYCANVALNIPTVKIETLSSSCLTKPSRSPDSFHGVSLQTAWWKLRANGFFQYLCLEGFSMPLQI